MKLRRASLLGWLLGPVLAASVALWVVLAVTGPRLLTAFAAVGALGALLATFFLNLYAALECHRLLVERVPELVQQRRIGSPYWGLNADRMMRAVFDERVRNDEVLRPALSLLWASRLAPAGLLVGLWFGQFLSRAV